MPDKPLRQPKTKDEMASVIEKIGLIEKAGFGEVRILIRNGCIYRIQTIEDEMVKAPADSTKTAE